MTAGAPGASAQTITPQAPVDSQVYADLASSGTTSFFVYLPETADLAGASALDSRTERAEFVYDTLTSATETSQADVRSLLDKAGADYIPFWIANTIYVTGDRALLDQLAGHPDVSHIEADNEFHIIEPVEMVEATDSSINAIEWGVSNINANQVWSDFGVTGEGITVASIDTGVRYTHNAVVNQYRGNLGGGNFDHNYNWFDPTGQCSSGVPCDNNNHGTHVTGTMVGDDGGSNQIGVAPGAKWIAAKGCASSSCSSSHLLASGQWMAAPTDLNGQNADPSKAPHVVNNSWGGGRGDTWYQATINAWVAAGIFPMFSAGNSGSACNTANSPADNVPAYAIGAYDVNNNIASFSSRGYSGVDGNLIKPDASAPGVAVRSATAGSNTAYGSFSGTSMASPHAAGLVALVWSAEPSYARDITATRNLLDSTARSVSALQCGGTADNNNVFGQGRLDAHAAVVAAGGGTPPPPPPPPDLEADFTAACNSFWFIRWCNFNGSPSTGDITSYNWNFGDGATGSGQTVTHYYGSSGTRNVTLTVTDTGGATDSITKPVSVP